MNVKVSQTSDTIYVHFIVTGQNRAEKFNDGRVRLVSDLVYQGDKKADSWIRSRDPQIQFGTDTIDGTGHIIIRIDDLYRLAMRASRNKNKKAQQGPARAEFKGVRQFKPEETD